MKRFLIITLSLVFTLALLAFQRITGPTHPVKGTLSLRQGTHQIKYRLIRSHETTNPACIEITLDTADTTLRPRLFYMPYPQGTTWESHFMTQEPAPKGTRWFFSLPPGVPAAKWTYYIDLSEPVSALGFSAERPLVLRYRDPVPLTILLIHVFLMFTSFLFSTMTFFSFLWKRSHLLWLHITFISFLLGAFVFGPLVQKYAFGAFWTGFPFGTDLTDNKVLLSLLFWFAAWIFRKSKPRLVVLAWISTVLVFLIPHSLMGSQYNHRTGKMDHVFTQNLDHSSHFYDHHFECSRT